MNIQTVKIKPSSPEQGEYIIINADDFDDKKHVKYEAQNTNAQDTHKKRGYNKAE